MLLDLEIGKLKKHMMRVIYIQKNLIFILLESFFGSMQHVSIHSKKAWFFDSVVLHILA